MAVGQMSGAMNQIQQAQQTGKIPGQGMQPHQAQSITVLRSGKVIDNRVEKPKQPTGFLMPDQRARAQQQLPDVRARTAPLPRVPLCDRVVQQQKPGSSTERDEDATPLHMTPHPYIPPVPYPSRLKSFKQGEQFREFYNMISKVNVNLPLLDVIRNVPAYVRFFKDLVSKKKKFDESKPVAVSEVACSIMQQTPPLKQRDPGSFVIDITLGNGKKASGMLDLGAGINLMPYSIFKQLELGELKPTRMCLQLADRSIRHPRGIIEDVLVCVGGLIVPVDFVVLEIGEVDENAVEHTLLLGRPFMATTSTLIDVKNGTITMSVLGENVSFSVHKSRPIPAANYIDDCSFVDTIDTLVEESCMQDMEKNLDSVFVADTEIDLAHGSATTHGLEAGSEAPLVVSQQSVPDRGPSRDRGGGAQASRRVWERDRASPRTRPCSHSPYRSRGWGSQFTSPDPESRLYPACTLPLFPYRFPPFPPMNSQTSFYPP